jgi:hypothetical protein
LFVKGGDYKIPLSDSASGFQSVVPMYVVAEFLSKITERGKRMDDLEREQFIEQSTLILHNPRYTQEQKDILLSRLADGINIQSVFNIIEEPEQNLFPQTQVDLFNDIVSLSSTGNQSSVFITTHSPYLLAAANILLFAGKLHGLGVEQEKVIEITQTNAIIPQNEFTAYSVSEGTCTPLVDEQTGLIKENELDTASDYNAEVFDQLYQLYVQNLRK